MMILQNARMTSLKRIFSRSFSNQSTKGVLVEKHANGVCVITLNDPNRMNALTASMGDEFSDIIDDLCAQGAKDLSAVVLTGAGRAFSAGGDLDFLRKRTEDTPMRNSIVMRRFYQRFLKLRQLPVPIIAAINGPAVGAGMCVALACDIRIASPSAKLGFTFTQIGLHPGMGATHFLPQVVGSQHAMRLLLTGKLVDADHALQIGLVSSVSDKALEDSIELANQIAANSTIAVRTCVKSLRMGQDEGMERSLCREADAQSQCYASPDLMEGVNAVAKKQKPAFKSPEGLEDN